MANSPSAAKRARQNVARRALRSAQRSAVRTALKRVEAAVAKGSAEEAGTEYRAAVSLLDRMASKGVIHARKSARHKSHLNARIRALAAS